MFRNYLRVTIRNLRKYKAFSSINIIGLAVGVATCLVIFLYVNDEMSYDRFNVHADQIYRVYLNGRINNHNLGAAVSAAPLGPAMKHEFPDVKSFTRIRKFGAPVIRYGDKVFSEEKFFWVDSTFFNVFTCKFIEGEPKTALNHPNTVLLTEQTAKKYFGNENPVGKILVADNKTDYMVTGIVKAFPQNSHFHFDFLGSLSSYPNSKSQNWLSNNYHTYVLLRKGTNPDVLQNKLNDYIKKFVGPQLKLAAGITLDQFKAAGNRYEYDLDPLTSIHLHSHLDAEFEPNSDISYIYIFSAIAIAILLIACINFMNLSTARSEKRAKEVGIRKTLGSNKRLLIIQLIIESVMMTFVAVILAVGAVEVLLPAFNELSGKQISTGILFSVYTLPLLILFTLIVGVVAGSYPAFFLSSFQPIDVLKKDKRKGSRKTLLRSGLVIFQFTVSIVLFIGTIVIYNQLGYIQNKNLGFDKEQMVIINKTDDLGNRIDSFKKDLLNNADILSVSNSTLIPGVNFGNSGYQVSGKSAESTQILWELYTDYNFMSTYKIKMKEGRFFSEEHPADTTSVVINEAAANVLGLKNPVGQDIISLGNNPKEASALKIIGVLNDFNYESLHQKIRPLVIHLLPKGYAGKYITARIAPGNYKNTISYMDKEWNKFSGGEAFDYNFFDQDWAHLYYAEQNTSKIASIFSFLAIFIASLGLLGLAAFVTEQRTKEIGIRKVLGASIFEIIILLSKEFAKWVILANIIAWPLAFYVMQNWLNNFAYKTNIGLWIFPLSGLLALLIAFSTVSTHAVKAARANPIKSLRYE